ncbi:guanylate kinase [Candidatus Gracilibacteria bacterium]|nr:guanylate kinase [Candidatus Gracilibacteria bacterium]
MTGKIFFIMGISGAGKGNLITNLKNTKDSKFIFPLSYRSRPIRETEKNGVDSWFVTKEQFEDSIKAGEFLEYKKHYGLEHYYGTKYADVIENGINKGKIVIKEIDMGGLLILKNEKPELNNSYKTIFLTVPFEVQEARIKKRGVFMSKEELEKRKLTAIEEIKNAKIHCDYMIDTSDKSKEEVLKKVLDFINSYSN